MIEETLKRAEAFLGLDDNELKMISGLPSSHYENHPSGYILFTADSEAKYIYILEEGQINIVFDANLDNGGIPTRVLIDTITKGGVFGWSALVKPHIYLLSAICQSSCKVAIINGAELRALIENNKIIGYKILQGLSQIINSRFRGLEQVLVLGKRWPLIEKLFGV